MTVVKKSIVLASGVLTIILVLFTLEFLTVPEPTNYKDLQTVLTTSTATFGTILGIITAGLMFTQGRFSALSSELSEKLPEYITEELSLEKVQSSATRLVSLQRAHIQLAKITTVSEEKSLYEKIITKTSSMLVDFAVFLNLKLKQQGLPNSDLLLPEMDSNVYKIYEKRGRNIKKEWHLFKIIKQIIDAWEPPISFSIEKPNAKSALHSDLNNSISILKLREKLDKNSASTRREVEESTEDLHAKICRLINHFHKDRIAQLLSQIEQASALRGKYFYLTLFFIAAPFLANLLILPQLTAATAIFFRQIILVTSLLSIIGVIFLLLYIRKILSM